jgi:hypothetical protein
MTVDQWLEAARADLRRRCLDDAVPIVEGIAGALRVLRAADWNEALDAAPGGPPPPSSPIADGD